VDIWTLLGRGVQSSVASGSGRRKAHVAAPTPRRYDRLVKRSGFGRQLGRLGPDGVVYNMILFAT
jgi:hypothetical protein